jgi:hypothetical protein
MAALSFLTISALSLLVSMICFYGVVKFAGIVKNAFFGCMSFVGLVKTKKPMATIKKEKSVDVNDVNVTNEHVVIDTKSVRIDADSKPSFPEPIDYSSYDEPTCLNEQRMHSFSGRKTLRGLSDAVSNESIFQGVDVNHTEQDAFSNLASQTV